MRTRAARLAQGPQTNSQSNVPAIGQKIASQAHRPGVAARCPAPAVPKRIEVELALIDSYDRLLTALACSMLQAARPQKATTRYRLHTMPGMGQM
jgi:hypothetical protein